MNDTLLRFIARARPLLPATVLVLLGCCPVIFGSPASAAEPLKWTLSFQRPTNDASDRYHRLTREESWPAEQTAIIVCDMWDLHHCRRAVLRETEMAPRLDQVLKAARARGVTIIHAPSSCMETYADHPARRRAIDAPAAASYPEDIQSWCYKIPAEEQGVYPIDQSNGGEDDEAEEHAEWAAHLTSLGRNPKAPWKSQTDLIEIDGKRDYISDQGKEVWNILESRGIQHVILTGVHTNMCVLGRPFGLRQMVRAGKQAALMRDMTDTMYDPRCHPFVSHFTGTDLIIDHIERHVCGTITSDQLIGGKPFRYAADQRPTVAILMAEDEYQTEQTLPPWSVAKLGKQYRLRWIFGNEKERHDVPGIDAISDADVLIVSVRRRPLPSAQLEAVRKFVASGKSVLGIRTASHAFCLRDGTVPEGTAAWPEFDAEVFGGHYTNHYGNQLTTTVERIASAKHPLADVWGAEPFTSGGSLYKTSPLASGAEPFLMGAVNGHEPEPVAWTFRRADGGRSLYTSLGHRGDFENPRFQDFLAAAVDWLVKE